MRSDWLPVSAASLVIGATGLFFVSNTLPRPGGEGEVFAFVATMDQALLSPALVMMLAGAALIFGLPTIFTLFSQRARVGIFGLVCMVMGALSLVGLGHQLMLVRRVVEHHPDDVRLVSEIMGDAASGWLLVAGFAVFYVGELCVAWELSRVPDVPRWVAVALVVHVLVGAVALPLDAPFLQGVPSFFMSAALAGAGIAAVRRTAPVGAGSTEIGLRHARGRR